MVMVTVRLAPSNPDQWTLTAPVGAVLECWQYDADGTGWFEMPFENKRYRFTVEAHEFEGLLFPLDYTLYEAVQVIAQKYEQFKPQRIEMQWLPG